MSILQQIHFISQVPCLVDAERLSKSSAKGTLISKINFKYMETPLYNQKGESAGKLKLSETIFNVPWNADLVHQVVVSMTSSMRHPIANTKTRGEVSGTGKKPWQQKGTGR